MLTVRDLMNELEHLPADDYVTLTPGSLHAEASIQFVSELLAGDGRTWVLTGGDYLAEDNIPRDLPRRQQ